MPQRVSDVYVSQPVDRMAAKAQTIAYTFYTFALVNDNAQIQ